MGKTRKNDLEFRELIKIMKTIITTDRIILREFDMSDDNDMFELDSNPEVHKYLGNNPVKSIEQSREMIIDILKQYKENGTGRLAIIDKNTQEFIGWSGLKYETKLRKEFNYYDIGYRLKQKHWGQGYAKEAAFASLKYGFEKLNLVEICGAADPKNLASNKILINLGMKSGNVFRYDETEINWYTITKEEWLNKKN
jgi:ribosomal-protein-alanine N-acetyltransferase